MSTATARRGAARIAPRSWPKPDPASLLLALPAFVAGKLLTVAVLGLTVWGRSATPGTPTADELGAPYSLWDGRNYLDISEHNYPSGPLDLVPGHAGHLWGFFPGYPMLVRAAAALTGGSATAAVLVSAVAELVALYYLVRLVRLERDSDSAAFATWLLALYPYAVFLTVAYTEAPFIAAATAALYHLRRDRFGPASAAAAIAVAVRITGVAVLAAMLLQWALRRGRRRPGRLLLVGASAFPLLLFALDAWARTGDALAYLHAQGSASFGFHRLAWPWSGALATYHLATSTPSPASYDYVFLLEVIAGTAGAVAVAALWLAPRVPRALAGYATVVWLMSVSQDFWLGVPRYEAAMMPAAVLVVADATRGRPAWRTAVVAVSAGLAAYGTSVFATGRFLG